jgi:predicted DNA binding protein
MSAAYGTVMQYIDAWVRVKHPCPFCDISSRYPEANMTLWLSVLVDTFQVSIPPYYDVHKVIDSAKDMLLYSMEFHDNQSAIFLLNHPFMEEIDSVVAIAQETDCLLIPPISFFGGWETHHIICQEQQSLRNLVEMAGSKGEVEVLSQKNRDHSDFIREVSVVPTHFIESLTPRQVNVLVNSYEYGLFDVPARAKMDKVADKSGLSRSTFGEHLRKAELQIMRNLYPFLKLRCCQETPGLESSGGCGCDSSEG